MANSTGPTVGGASTAAPIVCTGCGKKYIWKPELAGKRLKCKCGTAMAVPAAAKASAPAKQVTVAPPKPKPARPVAPPPPVEEPVLNLDDHTTNTGDDLDALYDLGESANAAPARSARASTSAATTDSDYRCPSCGEGMEIGSMVCFACGFNLKTGERMKPTQVGGPDAPAQSAKAAGNRFGMFASPKPKKVDESEANKAELMKLAIPLVAVLLIVGAVVAYRTLFAGGGSVDTSKMNRDDVEVLRLTDSDGATEIHTWFTQNPQRMAGEWSEKQALYHADEWQSMGAKKVLAFGAAFTRSIAIELPSDPAQRKPLFDYEHKFAIEHNYKPAKDEGQKYLLLNLGL